VGLSDRQAHQRVLSERQNRYMVRQLCWVMTTEGLETYILTPRDPRYLDLLLEAVAFDQIYCRPTMTVKSYQLRGDTKLAP
jgi:hypothetical protein